MRDAWRGHVATRAGGDAQLLRRVSEATPAEDALAAVAQDVVVRRVGLQAARASHPDAHGEEDPPLQGHASNGKAAAGGGLRQD